MDDKKLIESVIQELKNYKQLDSNAMRVAGVLRNAANILEENVKRSKREEMMKQMPDLPFGE